LKNALLSFLRFLSESNLFISAGSFFSISGACAFAGISLDFNLAGFAFFAALFTYNFQRRIGDLHQDQSFSKTTTTMMIAGVLGMLFFFFQLKFFQLVVLAASGLISLAYAYPFIPSSRGQLSLRLVPGFKLWAIVLVWVISCAVLPLLEQGLDLKLVLFFTFQQAAFVTALTIPFDIRDLPVDYDFQKTLPQIFGIRSSRKIALSFLALSEAVAIGLYLLGFVTPELVLCHTFVLLLSAVLVSRAKTQNRQFYFTIAIDGMIILQGALFLLAEYYI